MGEIVQKVLVKNNIKQILLSATTLINIHVLTQAISGLLSQLWTQPALATPAVTPPPVMSESCQNATAETLMDVVSLYCVQQ